MKGEIAAVKEDAGQTVAILIVEKDKLAAETMAVEFHGLGHTVEIVNDIESAMGRFETKSYDLVFLNAELCKTDALTLPKQIKNNNASTILIMLASPDTISLINAELDLVIDDYLKMPIERHELEIKIKHHLEHRRLMHESQYLRHTQDYIYRFEDIIGTSPKISQVLSVVRKVATSNASVLIEGETGTGKELIASSIHYNSHRKNNNFIKVNCAALQENLLESELFGHEKGAFTGADKQRIGRFEQANFGTIFLDEIGDMSSSTQAKVLRVLQEQEFERLGGTKTIKVDVRLIAATNKDLKEAIMEGGFRDDLYYRLNVIQIKMPPLRERFEDIKPLAKLFLKKLSGEMKQGEKVISPEAMEMCQSYSWPGNIRELKNAIERAVLLSESDVINVDDLGLHGGDVLAGGTGHPAITLPPEGISLEEVERSLVHKALETANWVQKDAAKLLGLSRRVMHYKIKKFGITHPSWTKRK